MVYPTIWEVIILWVLFSVVGGFFTGYRFMILVHIVIVVLIIVGFFLGIGIHGFNLLIN